MRYTVDGGFVVDTHTRARQWEGDNAQEVCDLRNGIKPPVPIAASFDNEKEARAWFDDVMLNLEYADNFRFAYMDDPAEMAEFERRAHEGCCGIEELEVMIGGRRAIFGCNYGH